MSKKMLNKRILILTTIMLILVTSFSASFAAWWGTPGYEWALSVGLTGAKSKSQLESTVELDDLYATILKYLAMKNIYPTNKKIHHEDKMDGMDNVARGIADIINGYNDKESLNIQQFYIVENYCIKGYDTLENYKSYSLTLTRQDLKNIEAYLRLSKYRAATLIANRSDREYALNRLGYVKNSKIINYGMLPYTSKISRKEFLNVIYDLMSPNTASRSGSTANDYAIDVFYDSGVLIGYDTGLELDKLLNYTEMYTFLYRLETYDFETGTTKTIFSDMEQYIDDAYEGVISKAVLVDYLQDVAEETNYQVDLVTRLNEQLGVDWTVREAGDLLYEIYTQEGFTYTSGRSTITVKGKK